MMRSKMTKKRIVLIGVILIAAILCMAGGCDDDKEKYAWPDADIAKMLPEPKGDITYLSYTEGESLWADVECNLDQYKAYLEACQEMGFTENPDKSQSGDYYAYEADTKEGYHLSLSYSESMSIRLDADTAESEEKSKEETKTTSKETEKTGDGKVSSDFKETMDSYEDFMDGYVEFMKKYENSNDTASMMGDYADMMAKYSDYMAKIDAIDEDSLSDADLAYYLEVTARVEKKLLEVAY